MMHYYFCLSRLTSLMYLQIDQLGLKLSLYFTPGSKISKGVEALFGKVDTFTTPLDKAMVQNISKGENINFSISWSCTKPSMLSKSILKRKLINGTSVKIQELKGVLGKNLQKPYICGRGGYNSWGDGAYHVDTLTHGANP